MNPVASCMICGKQDELAVWLDPNIIIQNGRYPYHGVCFDCRNAAQQGTHMKHNAGDFTYTDEIGGEWVKYEYFKTMNARAIDYALIVEQFQKLLGVYTTTEALAKVSVLMREETESERLLSKALGYLQTCSDADSKILYKEILNAFGITDD